MSTMYCFYVREDDWVGLVSAMYCEIFSEDFLTPLQETDTTFHLKVTHSHQRAGHFSYIQETENGVTKKVIQYMRKKNPRKCSERPKK